MTPAPVEAREVAAPLRPKSATAVRLGSPTRRNWTWWTCQVFLRLLFATWLGYGSRGRRRIPEQGGGLIIANHTSFLDPLLAALFLNRPVSYLARDDLFRVPVIGTILRATYVRPISRDAGGSTAIRESVELMDLGFLCGIFPEGTRTEGEVGEFKPGFIALVRRSQQPVYPVGIAGAHRALGRGFWFLRPRRVRVVYGEPITAAEIAAFPKGRETEFVEFIRQRVIACQQAAETWCRGGAPPDIE